MMVVLAVAKLSWEFLLFDFRPAALIDQFLPTCPS
jgi:hypothetical protein